MMTSHMVSQMTMFAKDEGFDAAVEKLEKWRDVLKEMLEVCRDEECSNCAGLLRSVRESIAAVEAQQGLPRSYPVQ